MLRINVNKSASGAKKYYSEKYYSEGQKTQDYYSEKNESIGIWGGEAAKKLGLKGDIDKEDFASLCDNQIPGTNDKLTDRNNIERRVGYDFTFNASKSVSLAYTFGSDKEKIEILKAFHESVKDTMTEIESGMQTRVRLNGKNENRETQNIAYGEFTHFTSRPIDGVPDPHLHAHCFIFNATYDNTEQKWKAGEFGQINSDAPYYEAVFHTTLASKLKSIGYDIEANKNGFEIKGITRETIEKFSRRTEEIEKLALEKGISDNHEKDSLGSKTRESKRDTIPEPEQLKNWEGRLTNKERSDFQNLKSGGSADEKKKENYKEAEKAIDYSLSHHLERKSVSTDKEILTTAIKSSLGEVSAKTLTSVFAKKESVIRVKEDHKTYITTKEALNEENKLIEKAIDTKGRYRPINEHYQPKNEKLNEEQRNAITRALTSNDGITIIAGKAGTGKTTLMKEVATGVMEGGKSLFAFAPSAEASRVVQRNEGFSNANTMASLINSKTLQDKVRNSVVWIDEAGMISNKDMNKILDITRQQNARLILTGDVKQHNSVERGDALRILQKEGGITPIHVSKIQRQKDELYKAAVSFLSESKIDKGFKKLEKIGAIHEIENPEERMKIIAQDYLVSAHGRSGKQAAKEVLVVSPTHAEGERVTREIRNQLREGKVIGQDEVKFTTLKNMQFTVAEKQSLDNYKPGNWIVFSQNTKGIRAGSRLEIVGSEKGQVLAKTERGNEILLSTQKAKSYNIYEPKEVGLSKGDKIRITGNGKAIGGKHLFNGTMYNVTGFDKFGNIKLSNGSSITKNYGHFNLGYVLTSHASQGKTVDKVIISQSSLSFRASSQEQFYVSVSRGKQAVSIYTDDKADLLRAVTQSNERRSAVELTKTSRLLNRAMDINRRKLIQRIKDKALQIISKQPPPMTKTK